MVLGRAPDPMFSPVFGFGFLLWSFTTLRLGAIIYE